MNWQTVRIITREDSKTIASNILKELRTERNMTQAQFAEWLEIPKRTYEKWESSESVPPTWVIKLIRFKCEKSTQGEQISIYEKKLITIQIIKENDEWEQIVDNLEEAEQETIFWKNNGALKVYTNIYKKI